MNKAMPNEDLEALIHRLNAALADHFDSMIELRNSIALAEHLRDSINGDKDRAKLDLDK